MAAESRSAFTVRALRPGDVPLIRDSWKRSYEAGGKAPKCEPLLYWEGQSQLIDALLKRAFVLVACNPEDPDQVFGWVAFERVGKVPVVHYAFTKSAFRKAGVASALLADATAGEHGFHTHRTPDGERWARKLGLRWNPYLLGGIG